MLKNHERTSKPLTAKEKSIIPLVVKGLERYDKGKKITAAKIIEGFNIFAAKEIAAGRAMVKLNPPLLRRIIHHLREHCILPVISGDGGYYVETDVQELDNMELSMRQRARSINAAADGVAKMAEFYRRQPQQANRPQQANS